MKTIRVDIRLRNNRLVERREELGLSSTALADAAGIARSQYSALETMREKPCGSRGWSSIALKLAEYHAVPVEELFPEDVLSVRKTMGSLKVDSYQLKALTGEPAHAALLLEEKEDRVAVHEAMALLSKKETRVVRLRFGFDGNEKTLDEVATELGLSRERIRQIESRALRVLAKSRKHESFRDIVDLGG